MACQCRLGVTLLLSGHCCGVSVSAGCGTAVVWSLLWRVSVGWVGHCCCLVTVVACQCRLGETLLLSGHCCGVSVSAGCDTAVVWSLLWRVSVGWVWHCCCLVTVVACQCRLGVRLLLSGHCCGVSVSAG